MPLWAGADDFLEAKREGIMAVESKEGAEGMVCNDAKRLLRSAR